MLLPPYTTGTVSVSANGTTVTGSGTAWTDLNAREGDTLRDPTTGYSCMVLGRGDAAHLTVPAWKGSALSAAAYEIYPYSPLRFADGEAVADLAKLLAIINGATIFYIVDGSAPDDSLGEDGNMAIKINSTPWRQWVRTGGTWVSLGVPVGINGRGAWSNIATYAVNDWVTDLGIAYISSQGSTNQRPPNATYWAVLGAKGDKGDKGDTGNTGNAATIAVGTVTTGAAGSAAAVNNSGSSSVATLNFTIPRGDQGIQGIQGPTPVISGTSASVLSVGTGSKTFATQAGIAWVVGTRLRAVNAGGDRVMVGLVTAYSGSSLTINVDTTQGVGADNTWSIHIAGEAGQQGGSGVSGPGGAKGDKGDKGDTGADSTVPGPKGDTGSGASWNASGTLAQRSTYDGQTIGYAFLQTDVSPFLLWVKASNTSADWAGPTPIGGTIAIGDLGHASDTLTQSFDLGHAA